jgi:hypothetical protein
LALATPPPPPQSRVIFYSKMLTHFDHIILSWHDSYVFVFVLASWPEHCRKKGAIFLFLFYEGWHWPAHTPTKIIFTLSF